MYKLPALLAVILAGDELLCPVIAFPKSISPMPLTLLLTLMVPLKVEACPSVTSAALEAFLSDRLPVPGSR